MKFLVNPNRFNSLTDLILKPLMLLSITLIVIGLIFAFSREDSPQRPAVPWALPSGSPTAAGIDEICGSS